MPKYEIRDSVTYDRRWVVEARDEDEAIDKALNEGPNETLIEEQTDNTPYSARRMRENPREKGDDDGVEYGDPRDERDERRSR